MLLAAIAFWIAALHLDPGAMALLAHMSATLSNAKSLVVTARIEREQLGADGQMLNYYVTTRAAMRRPNLFYTATAGDVQPYATWYDGTVLTVYLPRRKTVDRFVIDGNDDALMTRLSRHYDISSPLAPFLAANPYAALRRQIVSARIVGDVQAGDILCKQLAFVGKDIDWQLWVTIDDDNPLPARVAVLFKHRPGKPRVVVEFVRWDLDVPLSPQSFRFRPPAGVRAQTPDF